MMPRMAVLFCIENDTPLSQQWLQKECIILQVTSGPLIQNSYSVPTETSRPLEIKFSDRLNEICKVGILPVFMYSTQPPISKRQFAPNIIKTSLDKICKQGRQFMNIRMTLGIISMIILVFLSSTDTLLQLFPVISLQPSHYHAEFVLNALRSDTLAPFIPILAVLPFTASYIDDVKSRFARFFLIRTGYTTYLANRIVVCFLSGGFVIATGALLAWGISALLFLPMEKAAQAPFESTALLLKTLGLLFLNGGLWAVVGMTMSTLMESKYIAYASPFVIYYLLVILYERYFPDCFLICPREWVTPSNLWPLGFGGPAILMIELTILFAFIFVFRAGRRLREL